jgi:membrane protease YdiL (CAAX protease family)
MATQEDNFSKKFYYIVPFLIPIIVASLTYLFYPIGEKLIWIPLIIIYWITIWGFSLFYNAKRGSVFQKERFKFTLKLKGEKTWLQYLLVYGPFIYNLPIFLYSYATKISATMYLVILIAALINGPTEEVFWRACMEEVGKNAGASEKHRLWYGSIVFALWHTAFVLHLYPHDNTWWIAWAGIIAMTFSSGLIWMWVMHKSERLVPQALYHSVANFLFIFPMLIVNIIQFYF